MADHALDWQARCPFWPRDVADRYREAGIWRYETFFDLLARQAGRLGRRIALIDDARQIGYDRLHRDALALAGGLSALGLVRGDRVVVQFPNCGEFVTLFFALCRLGVVPVLALPGHRDLELGQFADFTGARAILTAQEPGGYDMVALARRVQDKVPSVRHVVVLGDGRDATPFDSLFRPDLPLPAGPNAEDVACFQISGGTTGVPKLIPRRHMEYLYNIRMAVAASGLDGDTRYLCVLPMMHNFPMACPGFLGTLQAGGTVVVAPEPEAGICFDLIARHRVTMTALVPPLALLWLDAQAGLGADLSSLQLLQVGGAKLNPSSARRIRPELGCQLQQVFGMAEGLVCFTALTDSEERIVNTQGRPMSPWDELRIIRPDGREAAIGEPGELQVRGPYTIRGYYDMAGHNAQAFTADGFYRSGDIARRDADGAITVEGRAKDQVNRGGEKIGVDEVEDLLVAHASVLDAAVVGRPDALMGERLCAFVLAAPGTTPRPGALRRHLAEAGLAAFKIPDEVIVLDRFPQTGVGKVNKRQLREQLREAHFPDPVAARQEERA
ncbi:AMP-binding protein [Paracoccus sp. SSJ]|uniref:(2,3-dihydroxybenzoyl)adenylate synthase n=1 Tax=Paracoccus sp. SSJ TaxID=3050636 RepID=UPI00254AE498|nr:AMP-binding protein [Paracoccus sp. SSJ]MDK8873354.1 AMP-binding protein [Paracoccus sp. SSJ]